jgi:hypothetical protein
LRRRLACSTLDWQSRRFAPLARVYRDIGGRNGEMHLPRIDAEDEALGSAAVNRVRRPTIQPVRRRAAQRGASDFRKSSEEDGPRHGKNLPLQSDCARHNLTRSKPVCAPIRALHHAI